MSITVSILVPVYKVERFIEKCSKSLFEQTYKDIEFIFVDDCSPDNSIEVLKAVIDDYPNLFDKIKIITHEVNKGLAGARNTAICNALGEYILHVDSDDYIEKDTVQKLVNKAASENSDIVVFDYYLEWSKVNKVVQHNFDQDKNNYLKMVLSAQTENFVVNKLVRRSLYLDNSILHTQGLNFGEDYLVVPKLLFYAEKVSKVNEPFYHYIRFNDNSYTSSINIKNIEDLIFVYHELDKFLLDVGFNKEALILGCLNKKFELIRDSISIEKFKFIKQNFVIESQSEMINHLSGIKKLMLNLLEREKYFQLLTVTRAYKMLVNMYQRMKNRG